MLLFGSLFSMSPDWLVKLVQEGGRTRLTLISLVVVVVGVLAYLFFAKENTWVKIVTWLMIFGGAVFLIAVLVTPDKSDAQTNANGGAVQKALILAEVTDAYKSTGWELAFFDDWGRPPTRQTLHVNQTTLTGTSTDGRTVSMSVDPRQLPMPKYYNANSAQISTLGSKEAPEVIRFFSAYEQYRQALVNLTSAPSDFNAALTNAAVSAREALNRGRKALCAMGGNPPRLYPDGGFAEPVPPNCSDPFAP